MSKENNSSFKLNVGGPSIILLLCALGLSMFAILTIRAAYSGLKLARTSRDAVTEYYDADLAMDEAVFEINSAVMKEFGEGGAELSDAVLRSKIGSMPGVESIEDNIVTVSVRAGNSSSIKTRIRYFSSGNFELRMTVLSRRLVVDDMEGYSGTGFEIEEIELF